MKTRYLKKKIFSKAQKLAILQEKSFFQYEKKNGKILSFNDLQKRIGRKKVSSRILDEYPVHFLAYDILFMHDSDCRNLNLSSRKKKLESLLKILNVFLALV